MFWLTKFPNFNLVKYIFIFFMAYYHKDILNVTTFFVFHIEGFYSSGIGLYMWYKVEI